jgi:hypothetical protein
MEIKDSTSYSPESERVPVMSQMNPVHILTIYLYFPDFIR